MLAARKPQSRAVVERSLAVLSDSSGYAYAHRIIYTVCCLAGAASFVDDARDNLVNEGVLGAIEGHNTPVLFDWMVRAFSFQGDPSLCVISGLMHRSKLHRYSISSLTRASSKAPTTHGRGLAAKNARLNAINARRRKAPDGHAATHHGALYFLR